MPATNLDEVYDYFQSKPFDISEFDEFYEPADRGRGGKPAYSRLKRRLTRNPDGNLKMLFAGFRGCGKSTELLRLRRTINADMAVLPFSVMRELDLLNLNYLELFIVVMEKLFEFANENKKIDIAGEFIDNIKNWMSSVEIREISYKHLSADIDADIKAGLQIPFLADFFSRFRAAAKSSSSMKETLTKKVEPKLSELISLCNALIAEIRRELPKINKKGLVIIMEDLDKLDVKKGRDIFFDHSAQLVQLNAHFIYTFPIALLYNIRFRSIKDNYDEAFVLPMIKVFGKTGSPNKDGVEVMRNIVHRRMDPGLFADPSVLDRMICYSGGCLWDLFRMIKDAADSALDEGKDAIDHDDFKMAYFALKDEYSFTIAENRDRGISVEAYYNTLAECAKDPNKRPPASDIMLDLRNNLSVLQYNDENWGDVHPVVKDILKEKGLITDGAPCERNK